MTVSVQSIANTNTFEFWINRTNELANAMSTVAVTTNSNTAVGNAAISGTLTANKLSANSLTIANSTVNTSIGVPLSSQISSGDYYLNANGNWTQILTPIIAGSYQSNGTGSQEVDSYETAVYGATEYYIHIKNNNANGYHAAKILTLHNGNNAVVPNAYSTEYATITSNGSLGTFNVSSNGSHVSLQVTPVSTNTTINFSRVNF